MTSLTKKQWIWIGSIAATLLLLVMVIVVAACASGNCGGGGGPILTNKQLAGIENDWSTGPPDDWSTNPPIDWSDEDWSDDWSTPIYPPTSSPVSQPRPQPVPQPRPQPVPQPRPQPVPQPRPQPVPQPRPQPVPQPRPQPAPQPITPPVPDNDTCRRAEDIRFSSRNGSNEGASIDSAPRCNGESVDGPGVWFTIDGESGDRYTAETCSTRTDFDTKITVYRGSCSNLICVTANDDHNDQSSCSTSSHSHVTWDTEGGETYYILVHGYDSDEEGNFNLNIDSDPSPTPPSPTSPTRPTQPSPTSPTRPTQPSPSPPPPPRPTSSGPGSSCESGIGVQPLTYTGSLPDTRTIFDPCFGTAGQSFTGALFWYQYSVPSSGHAIFSLCGPNSDTSISVSGRCDVCTSTAAFEERNSAPSGSYCHNIQSFSASREDYVVLIYGRPGAGFGVTFNFVPSGGGRPSSPSSPFIPSSPSPPSPPSFSGPSGSCTGSRYIRTNKDCFDDQFSRCARCQGCCESELACQPGLRCRAPTANNGCCGSGNECSRWCVPSFT